MPEVGGKRLAADFGAMLADLRRGLDEAKTGIAKAIGELTAEVQSGKEIEKAIRSEAAEVRKAFGEILGNSPPAEPEPQSRPDPTGDQGSHA